MDQSKRCFKCGETLPLEAFYKHCGMSDGRLNKCKSCALQDVKNNRIAKIDYYREFDRKRASQPQRVAARKEHRTRPEYKVQHAKANKKYQSNNMDRAMARNALTNAVRDKRIEKLPCFICGLKAEAHHPSYSLPLDVVWLCDAHHKELHKDHRAYLRSKKSQVAA